MNSIWSEETDLKKYNALEKDIDIDTAIIGGGLAGILTAYQLKQKGIDAVIIEANRICSGQTKNTTAKITSQHGEIYNKISKYYGNNFARQYAASNENAILEYEKIINQNGIDCEFEKKDAYLYSIADDNNLKNELLAARHAGIDCYFTSEVNLPFKTNGAVVFKNQAQFNPLKFVNGIVSGLTVYENTKAVKIVGNTIYTPKAKINTRHIVVATHYPFINFPSFYFLKMSQERSYALALEKKKYELDGMYIGIENNSLSLRDYEDYILLGGSAHRTGAMQKELPFDSLNKKANELFPNHRIKAQWSAQDCITLDNIPYIGRFGGDSSQIYVATGFGKWGMSSSMASAKIISDMICGIPNENSEVFSPQRFNFSASAKNLLTNTGETIKGFSGHLKAVNGSIHDIPVGTGREVNYNGKKAGAYKDENGKIYIVTLKCPHLKCKLNWNESTKTWDCPCHGSRYNYKGELIDNPAQESSILIAAQ